MTREEAIGWLKIIDETVFGKEASNAIYIAIEALEEEPRKTAKWLPYEYGDERWHKCSNCSKPSQYRDYYKAFDGEEHLMRTEIQNYCRYCGAKMEEENETN